MEEYPYSVTEIAEWAFYECSGITDITISEGISFIKDGAFAGCSGLSAVTLPESLTSIGDGVFAGCTLLEQISIPDGITEIGNYSFFSCESLTEVNLPAGLTLIGEGAFSYCSALSDIELPYELVKIDKQAFSECSSLTEVSLPEGLNEIGDYGFLSCTSLTSVQIPETVTLIGKMAFAGCTALNQIVIPASVEEIKTSAFEECSNLDKVYFSSSEPPSAGENLFAGCPETLVICYPAGSQANWGTTWQGFPTQACNSDGTPITLTITAIDQSRPYGTVNPELTYTITDETGAEFTVSGSPELSTTATLESLMGEYPITAAQGTLDTHYSYIFVEGTLTVTLPETVTVGPLTFTLIPGTETYTVSFCIPSYLGKIIIPTLIQIGLTEEHHSEVTPADSLTYPVVSIEPDAFAGCSLITRIIIPETVASIGNAAFSGCTELEEVYFSSSEPPAMEIGTLFEGCSEELVIYYPENTEDNWTPALEGTTIPSQTWDPAVEPAPEEPSLTCGAVSKNPETGEISFTLTFTGTLQESADGITWSDVSDAAESSYSVTVQKNQNRFFRTVVH